MDNENIVLESRPISIASYTNYKEAVFLISVLDEPDGYGRIIPSDAGKKYYDTIIGYPIVAKLKKNIFGKAVDFGGHELTIEKDKNGKKTNRFNTIAIGSVIDAWVEEMEVDGYEGTPECILIKTKLWTSRFPEYFKVFDELWEEGKISSSWELTASQIEKKGDNKIYKVFEFIGNCILGRSKIPAVLGAGAISYAEFDDLDDKLSSALQADISDIDISDLQNLQNDNEKEDSDLNKGNKNVSSSEKETSTASQEETIVEPKVSEKSKPEEKPETASLTDRDLYRKITKACEKAIGDWGYISYWFPEEHTVWYKSSDAETQLDFKLFTYSVEDDEVTVSDPTDVKLTVSIAEVNTVLAEKDEKIGALTAELELKDQSIISAGEKINKLNVQISELEPYKAKVEKAEQERVEAEIAEEKESLKKNLLKGGLFTVEEIAKPEIAELIEARNKSAINSLIAEKYIASFDKDETTNVTEPDSTTATASLENDEVEEDAVTFMTNFLVRR